MNRFVQALTELDLAKVRRLLTNEQKWLDWHEPSGKNGLHFLCGARPSISNPDAALQILKLLLNKGLDINSIHRIEDKNCGYFPATPLWYAYTRGRNETLYKYLLKKGADPNHCWWAIAWYDDIAAAKLWLKNGAKINTKPTVDELFLGSFGWKKYDLAYWLLTQGANVDAADDQGNTALMVAVKRKDEPNIARLIEAGADPDKKNSKGDSPRSIAETKGPKRLLNLL